MAVDKNGYEIPSDVADAAWFLRRTDITAEHGEAVLARHHELAASHQKVWLTQKQMAFRQAKREQEEARR